MAIPKLGHIFNHYFLLCSQVVNPPTSLEVILGWLPRTITHSFRMQPININAAHLNTQNLMRSCNKSLVTIAQEWMWWNEHVIGSHSPLTVRNWRIMIWLWRSLWHAVIHDFLPYNLIFMFQMPQYTESMSISDTTSLNDNDMALEINSYVLCQSWGGLIHIIHIIHIILVNIMLYYTQIFGTCSVHIKQYHTKV